jgi:hypothetical protein
MSASADSAGTAGGESAAADGTGPRPRSRARSGADLALVALLACACALIAGLVDAPVVRIPAGLALELALPGYAISVLVFERGSLDLPARTLALIGTGLVVAALGGLLLAALPGHMGRGEWAGLLLLVTLIAAAGAALRPATGGSQAPQREDSAVAGDAAAAGDAAPARDAADSPDAARGAGATAGAAVRDFAGTGDAADGAARAGGSGGVPRPLSLLLAVVALGLLVAAVAIARNAARRTPGFTELSALPASPAHDPSLRIVLRSHEHGAERLRVVVRGAGRRTLEQPVSLAPGGRWLMLTAPVSPSAQRVVVDVYRGSASSPLLYTSYWLPPPRAPAALTPRAAARTATPRASRASGARARARPAAAPAG